MFLRAPYEMRPIVGKMGALAQTDISTCQVVATIQFLSCRFEHVGPKLPYSTPMKTVKRAEEVEEIPPDVVRRRAPYLCAMCEARAI